jgi:transposase-like protein
MWPFSVAEKIDSEQNVRVAEEVKPTVTEKLSFAAPICHGAMELKAYNSYYENYSFQCKECGKVTEVEVTYE